MKLSESKQVNVRSTTQILDFLGDIGGYLGSMELIFGFVGTWFSAKLIFSHIAQKMFLQPQTQNLLKI